MLVVLACAGCDVVAGVDVAARPCDVDTFAGAPVALVDGATSFSVSWDRDLLVYTEGAQVFEQALPDGEPQPIDLGIYPVFALALAPEADALFYSAAIEPPQLTAALRAGPTAWTLDGGAPIGSFAGTPSSPEFGPRHVLVRLTSPGDVQEYEQDGDTWRAVGEVHPVDGGFAPNLSASGLDVVFESLDGVFVAHRDHVGEWFGEATAILPGEHHSPQLLDRCRELYVIDPSLVLNRYDR